MGNNKVMWALIYYTFLLIILFIGYVL